MKKGVAPGKGGGWLAVQFVSPPSILFLCNTAVISVGWYSAGEGGCRFQIAPLNPVAIGEVCRGFPQFLKCHTELVTPLTVHFKTLSGVVFAFFFWRESPPVGQSLHIHGL